MKLLGPLIKIWNMTDILSSALIKEMRYSLVKCIKIIPIVD